MSDTLTIQTLATFVRETPAETSTLFNKSISQTPTGFEKGEIELGQTSDKLIADTVNIFNIVSDAAISIKIGSTAATAITGIKSFSYNSSTATSFYITNPSSTKTKIYYMTAVIS